MRLKITTLTICILLLLCTQTLQSQEFENIEQIGITDENPWDRSAGLDIQGDLVYVATGSTGLQIVDISNLNQPEIIGSWADDIESAFDVKVRDDYAFLTDWHDGVLWIIDVSDPSSPDQVAHIRTGRYTRNIDVQGDLIFIANDEDGLGIIDISDIQNPELIGSLELSGDVRDVKVVGDLLYVASWHADPLRIIDISDPGHPALISSCDNDIGNRATSLCVDGDLAYIADGPSGLRIVDVSDTEHPEEISHWPEREGPWENSLNDCWYVVKDGDYLFVSFRRGGMQIIDVSDPFHPVASGYFDSSWDCSDILIRGQVAILASYQTGLFILDVSDIQNPQEISRSYNCKTVNRALVLGDYSYTALIHGGLGVIDISDPQNPIQISVHDVHGGVYDLQQKDDLLYLLISNTHVNHVCGLQMLDFSDPENLVEVGMFHSGDAPRMFCLAGDYAFIKVVGGVQIVDLTDLENPCEIGFFDPQGGVRQMKIDGDLLYLAVNGVGFIVLDISDPADPIQIGQTLPSAGYFCLAGDLAFVTYNGLQVIDISDPRFPAPISHLHNREEYGFLRAAGNILYASNDDELLQIFDISNPQNLQLAGYYDTPGEVRGGDVVDDLIYVADKSNLGVYHFTGDISDPNVSISPFSLTFAGVGAGRERTKELVVTNIGDDNLTISNLSLNLECFETDFDEPVSLEPDEQVVFHVTFSPDQIEEFDGVLVMTTDDEKFESVNIILKGIGVPNIYTDHEELNFGDVLAGEQSELMISVFNETGSEQTITDITLDDDGFITDFAGEVSIAADESYELAVLFQPDEIAEYEGILTFIFESQEIENITIPLTGNGTEVPEGQVQHFTNFVHTQSSQSVLISAVTRNGENVPTGWEIGVFTPDDVLCGACTCVEGEMVGLAAWAAGGGAHLQFQPHDPMHFRLWDNEADEEFNTTVEFLRGLRTWNGGMSQVVLDASDEVPERVRNYELQEGWNMISLNIFPAELWEVIDGPDVIRMLEQIQDNEGNHHILLIKDEAGQFYTPGYDFNNIPFWNICEGYQVKVDESLETTWEGSPVAAASDISLTEGWNIVAYFPTYELDAAAPDFTVLAPVIDHVLTAKNAVGEFMIPEYNFSNMSPWCATQGYQIRVDENVILNYPAEAEDVVVLAEAGAQMEANSHWAAPCRTNNSMSLLINTISGMEGHVFSQAAAFNSQGKMVGLGSVDSDGRCGIAIWGDDVSTKEYEGLQPGEAFELKIWDSEKEQEQCIELKSVLTGKGLMYQPDSYTVIEAVALNPIPENYYLQQNFPNPFNSVTRINYGLSEASAVSINIFDTKGRHISTLVDNNQSAGHYSRVWNAEGVPSGIYIIRMESSSFRVSNKVTLIR